jgi:hypothetical protein
MKPAKTLASLVLGLCMATSVQAQAQQCMGCTGSANSCNTWNATKGYKVCSCPCSCEDACGLQRPQGQLTDILNNADSLPENGLVIMEIPENKYLESLDKGKYNGVVVEGVYFGDNFGIIVKGKTAIAFPLETKDKFSLRNCSGGFVARFKRMTLG